MMDESSLLGLENYAELMILMNKKEELNQTLEQFTSSRKLDPGYDPVLGEIYVLLQQPERARSYLFRAIENTPEDPANYIHLSSLMDAEGKTQDAITYLEQHREQFQAADYLLQLGRLCGKSGNARKEFELFREMVQTHPQDARGYFFLGKVYLQQNDMRQVIRLADMGLRLNPDPEFQPFGYFLLGDAYSSLGDQKRSQSYLKKAEELQQRLSYLRAGQRID